MLVKPKTDPDNLFQWIYRDTHIDALPVVCAGYVGVESKQALLSHFDGSKICGGISEPDPAQQTPLSLTASAGLPSST